MPTVVFGVEVPVESRRQGDFGQEHFQRTGLVSQFMGRIDRNTGGGARRHGHAQVGEPARLAMQLGACRDVAGHVGQRAGGLQVRRCPQQAATDDPVDAAGGEPTGHHERGDHQQHAGVDDPAVVALRFEVADGGFGRVADVFTEQAVDQRDQAEDHQHTDPPQLLNAGGDGQDARQ